MAASKRSAPSGPSRTGAQTGERAKPATSRAKPPTPQSGAASGGAAARPGGGVAGKRLEAPLLDGAGKAAKTLTLERSVFGSEVKPHLVHEAVRAELNAARAGTRGGKSRGEVAGGRAKPWRQKGTGRARAGTIRAPHFTGGGLAFPPQPRKFEAKVNRKARKAALRAALTSHTSGGTLGVIGESAFDGEPSTRRAAGLLGTWGKALPTLVVTSAGEETLAKSFRNLARVVVVTPAEVEVSAVVWARSVLVTQEALEAVQGRAS